MSYYIILMCLIPVQCRYSTSEIEQGSTEINKRIAEDLSDRPATGNFNVKGIEHLPDKRFVADKDHSSISFRTKHWEIVDLIGWVDDFDVVMYSDHDDFTDAIIMARADPGSIHMPNIKMAQSLGKFPYMDAVNFPEIRFESDSLILTGFRKYDLFGKMTINGISRPTIFDVAFNGYAYPGEQSICGFNIDGVIKRHEFEIGTDDELHSGRVIHDSLIFLSMSLRME